MKSKSFQLFVLFMGFISLPVCSAEIYTEVNFDKPLQSWDGFGVNYVQSAQARDNPTPPEDYGGFSTLSEAKRMEILQMTFGEDGLKPGLVFCSILPSLK